MKIYKNKIVGFLPKSALPNAMLSFIENPIQQVEIFSLGIIHVQNM